MKNPANNHYKEYPHSGFTYMDSSSMKHKVITAKICFTMNYICLVIISLIS